MKVTKDKPEEAQLSYIHRRAPELCRRYVDWKRKCPDRKAQRPVFSVRVFRRMETPPLDWVVFLADDYP